MKILMNQYVDLLSHQNKVQASAISILSEKTEIITIEITEILENLEKEPLI